SNRVSGQFSKSLGEVDITVPEWVMLRELQEQDFASVGSFGKITGMTKGAVSKVIDRLLKKKLVLLETSTSDRRSQIVRLTSKGEKLVPTLASSADKNDDTFFSCLSQKEKKELKRILLKVCNENQINEVPVT